METPAEPEQRRSRYYMPVDPTADNNVYAFELAMIGHSKRVLEFGCGAGHMTQALCKQGCRVVGVEVDPTAGADNLEAEEVLVADLDRDDFIEKLRGRDFDVALFGDVLEHLRDPGKVLTRVREVLVPGGFIVISVPNVAHFDVRMSLLKGRFDYGPYGLLDRTHLRFFTRDGIDQMLRDAGYVGVETRRVVIAPFASELAPDRDVPRDAQDLVLRDPEALTYQFCMKAVIDDGDRAVHDLAERCHLLEDKLHSSRVETELTIAAEVMAAEDRAAVRVRELETELATVRAEMDAIKATKVFRYSAGARSLYRTLVLGKPDDG
jgi:O-antigen biosynthesis protein